MIACKNTAVLKIIIVQAEISINNANCGKMLLLTLSSIMSLTLIETRGQINKKENDPFVPAIKKVTHLFFFYCLVRKEAGSCATDLLSFNSRYCRNNPPSLSFTLPLFSKTAHIWFWVKARLVSSGMEGFYFSMAPHSSSFILRYA